jgi:hypothetical protein
VETNINGILLTQPPEKKKEALPIMNILLDLLLYVRYTSEPNQSAVGNNIKNEQRRCLFQESIIARRMLSVLIKLFTSRHIATAANIVETTTNLYR